LLLLLYDVVVVVDVAVGSYSLPLQHI